MTETSVPAVFARGGTSKGLFFRAEDLPADGAARDRIFLSALGSPDPHGRQLDGMGGGLSSLSKAAVLGPPTHPDADVDYTFAQVSVDSPVVDYGLNCGNMAAAVAPVALELGLLPLPDDGPLTVRIHATNTGQLIEAELEVASGRAVTSGDLALDGVAGTGAPLRLAFLEPGGAMTGRLLPTGSPTDVLDVEGVGEVEVSLVDAANPVVFVSAESLPRGGTVVQDKVLDGRELDATTLNGGALDDRAPNDRTLTGAETPDQLEAIDGLEPLLERIRRAGAVAMGMAETAEAVGPANPKIAVVSPAQDAVGLSGETLPAQGHDITVRMVSMGRIHRAVTSTGALCLAAAAAVPGTLPHRMRGISGTRPDRMHGASGTLPHSMRGVSGGAEGATACTTAGQAPGETAGGGEGAVVGKRDAEKAAEPAVLRIGHPSGVTPVTAEVEQREDGTWHARGVSLFRTARILMRGEVRVRT